jgi:hypothetical protein
MLFTFSTRTTKTPRYQGAGSSLINPTKIDNAIDAFKKANLNIIGYEQGQEKIRKCVKNEISINSFTNNDNSVKPEKTTCDFYVNSQMVLNVIY